jgi:hypothetical protein
MKAVFAFIALFITGVAQAQQVIPQPKQAGAPPFYNEILAFIKQDAVAPPAPGGILEI